MVVLEENAMERLLDTLKFKESYSMLASVTRGLVDFFTGKSNNRDRTEVRDISALQSRVIIKKRY